MATDTQIVSGYNWIITHSILLALVGTLTLGGIYGVENLISKHDDATAAKYAAIADAQVKQNATFQQQVQQQIAILAAQNQQLIAANAQLASSLAARSKVEKEVPVQTANLSLAETAAALKGTVEGNNVSLTLPVAQDVLTQVQLVPLLQQDKLDLSKEVDNQSDIAKNNLAEYTQEKAAHDSDNKANAAVILANKKEIAAVKADARKGKIKWFVIGYVSGLISGIALHAAGI
jgi:hypothetical protein